MDRRAAAGDRDASMTRRKAPDSVARRRIVQAPVTFSEEDGVRYLHFGTEWIQGAMRLDDPDAIELEYAQQMMAWTLFIERAAGDRAARPRRRRADEVLPSPLARCGRGRGRAQPDGRRRGPHDVRVAAGRRAAVGRARRCRARSSTNPGTRVASTRCRSTSTTRRPRGPVLESTDFYAACRACLRAPGVLTVNLFGAHASFARNDARAEGRVRWPRRRAARGARRQPRRDRVQRSAARRPLDRGARARGVARANASKLPASTWVDGLRASCGTATTTVSHLTRDASPPIIGARLSNAERTDERAADHEREGPAPLARASAAVGCAPTGWSSPDRPTRSSAMRCDCAATRIRWSSSPRRS